VNELMHLGGLSLIRRRGGKNKTKKLKEIASVVCSGVMMMLCGTVPVMCCRRAGLADVEGTRLYLLVGRGG